MQLCTLRIGIRFMKDPGFRTLVGLRDPFDDLYCVEGISIYSDRLRKARDSNGTGEREKGLGVYMREARRSTSFKYTTWILAMQCSWTLVLIRMNHPFRVGLFVCVVRKEEDSMIIRSPEPEVKILVDKDPVKTSFEEWAKPGHFSRTIAKGPDTTTWIWNLHADAHDFDSHTSDLEEISRKVFSAHFGQLSIIFLWLSGMYFHGARFSNYEAWLSDPTHIGPSAQVVWPIVGQEILNGDVGGGFRGIQITSGFFQIWRASGITSELQLYCTTYFYYVTVNHYSWNYGSYL
ncbi:hypothetical protein CASFOL_007771 [Castilleja foliolosa]|uniref:Uncharacterized protein n=1 Tax=Castilleja foliolosa TaxID=1961234 RepID=A0ABD3E2V6_9LAMI